MSERYRYVTLHIFPDEATWLDHVTRGIAHTLADAVRERGRAYIALSGGSTPRPVYERLADRFGDVLPWQRIHLFWGDERYVPHTDPRSNYRMTLNALIRHVPIPPENVHAMPTYMHNPDRAAQAYEATLRAFFPDAPPTFDVVLLGLGGDCHTASLFPGSEALAEDTRWVVTAPGPDVLRLSLTYPVLNQARLIYFLVRGAGKAAAVDRVFHGEEGLETCPVRGIQPHMGEVHWWLDRAAAASLLH